MGGGGIGGGSKSKSEVDAYGPAKPFIDQILQQGQNNFQAGYGTQYYPGQNYVGPSQDTLAAQAMTRNRALSPSGLLGAAEGNLTDTLNGNYLSAGNPYFSQMAGRVADEVMPNLQGMFGGMGRAGSATNAEAMAQGLGDSIGALAYQNYGDERNRQMQGLGLAPSIEQAGYMPAQMLGGLGQQIEGYQGRRLAGDMERFNFQENAPWSLLERYQGVVSPFSGLGVTSQSSGGPGAINTVMQGVQGAAALATLFSSRTLKDIGPEVDGADVLAAVADLEVGRWNYRGDDAEHIGPYAEDFREAFGVGDGKTINVIDAIGVLFAAVKELTARLAEREAANGPA